MARVEEVISVVAPVQTLLTPEQQEVFDALSPRVESLVKQYLATASALNGRVTFGVPNDGTGVSALDNMEGSWVTVSLTDPNQLGAGSASPVTVSHNLDVPVQTLTAPDLSTVYLPNVRFGAPPFWQHGDRSAAANPPSALANSLHFSTLFRLGDVVTTNTIQLRFYSDIVPSTTAPVTVDLFLVPAVI